MGSVAYSVPFPAQALADAPAPGAVLERSILRQAHMVCRLRWIRGRLASALLTKKSWNDLGYARVGDYSRERLGIAGRTLEEDARVARALEHLPHLRSALLTSRLSWTKVRLVCAAADAATELEWIRTALACDTRSLACKIRTAARTTQQVDAASLAEIEDSTAPAVRFSVKISRTGRRLWRAACEMAERSAGSALTHTQVLELIVAEAASAAPRSSTGHHRAAPDSRAQRTTERSMPAQQCGFGQPIADPGLEDLERPCSSDPVSLDARLREVERAMQRIDASLGHLLHLALGQRIHRDSGFAKFANYVEERLGFCARKAWTLIALERSALRHSGELASAYRDGRISYLAASVLLPVMSSRFAAAWIERARTVTLRRLDAEVTWALDRRDAGPVADSLEDPAPPPLDHDLEPDRLSVLEQERVKMRAHGEAGTVAHEVDLTISAPVEVASLAEDTMLALRRGTETRGATFERMVACALLEWMSAPPHRDPVFERDGWRCAVPGCRSRRNLHDHHVLFRSHGGTNHRDNRITVCAAHHLHGLHAGRIRARGLAPAAILWELPLERFLGDRRL